MSSVFCYYCICAINCTLSPGAIRKTGLPADRKAGGRGAWDDESVFCEGMVGPGEWVTVAE